MELLCSTKFVALQSRNLNIELLVLRIDRSRLDKMAWLSVEFLQNGFQINSTAKVNAKRPVQTRRLGYYIEDYRLVHSSSKMHSVLENRKVWHQIYNSRQVILKRKWTGNLTMSVNSSSTRHQPVTQLDYFRHANHTFRMIFFIGEENQKKKYVRNKRV